MTSLKSLFGILLIVMLFHPELSYSEGCLGRLSDQPPCSALSRSAKQRLIPPPVRGSSTSASRPLNIRVVNPQLRNLDDKRGEWSGTVTGFGRATLYLQIVRQAQLLDEVRIGEVDLAGSPTPFKFRAPLPTIIGWEWRIATRAY